jgi:hypothetical protein
VAFSFLSFPAGAPTGQYHGADEIFICAVMPGVKGEPVNANFAGSMRPPPDVFTET